MLLFFREWMKHKKYEEYVAYDVTSVSSYSKNITELEWGYNRDKEKLPQINIGMYFGEKQDYPSITAYIREVYRIRLISNI